MKFAKYGLFATLFILLISNCSPEKDLPTKKVLILGNSITQQGTYVSFLDYFLTTQQTTINYDIISIGLSSETVSCLSEPTHPFPRPCLLERLDRALEMVKPDLVVACYGMNDGIYHPQSEERFSAYKKGINTLIAKVNSLNAQLILMTPPTFDAQPISDKLADSTATTYGYQTPYSAYDQVLSDYAQWLLSLEQEFITVVDIHYLMSKTLEDQRKTDTSFSLAGDGIHPSEFGHYLMAATLKKAFGIMETPLLSNEQFLKDSGDILFQKIHERRTLISEAWLPYVGYTREKQVKKPDLGDLEIQKSVLDDQIQDLEQARNHE